MSEDNLFDEIARTLASPMPRRQALGRIVGVLAGAALVATFGTGQARADGDDRDDDDEEDGKKCKKNRDCPENKFCCGGVCRSTKFTACDKACCPPGQVCKDKRCKQKGSPSKPGKSEDDDR